MTSEQFYRLAAALAAQTEKAPSPSRRGLAAALEDVGTDPKAEAAGRGVGAGLTGAERARAREAMDALLKAKDLSNEIGGLHIRLHRLLIDAWQQLFDLLLLEPESGGKEEEK